MKHSLDIVDELYATLNVLKPLKPEDQNRLDRKFRLEFNYNSNHIEGNTLTYGETELLLIFDDTRGNHQMREYEETKSHDVAYHMVEQWASDVERPLTEQIVKNLNEIILVRPYWKDAITPDGQTTRRQIKIGNYKEYANSVRLQNGEMFDYASPTDTPILMRELLEWYRAEEGNQHPVSLATILHYKFVRIHPFDDGNGRISRLLMNYVLLKNSYPPIIIQSSDKNNYLRALHNADVGDFEPLNTYIAQQVAWSLRTSIKAARGENIAEPEDWEKELQMFKKKIGLDKDSKIEVKYNAEVIENIYLSTIKPFVVLWEETLKKFETLFFYKKNIVDKSTNHTFYENKGDSLIASLEGIWYKTAYIKESNRRLKLRCQLEKLITSETDFLFNAGEIEFFFHDNALEIKVKDLDDKILRYDEEWNKKSIQDIINFFLNNLMNEIKALAK